MKWLRIACSTYFCTSPVASTQLPPSLTPFSWCHLNEVDDSYLRLNDIIVRLQQSLPSRVLSTTRAPCFARGSLVCSVYWSYNTYLAGGFQLPLTWTLLCGMECPSPAPEAQNLSLQSVGPTILGVTGHHCSRMGALSSLSMLSLGISKFLGSHLSRMLLMRVACLTVQFDLSLNHWATSAP